MEPEAVVLFIERLRTFENWLLGAWSAFHLQKRLHVHPRGVLPQPRRQPRRGCTACGDMPPCKEAPLQDPRTCPRHRGACCLCRAACPQRDMSRHVCMVVRGFLQYDVWTTESEDAPTTSIGRDGPDGTTTRSGHPKLIFERPVIEAFIVSCGFLNTIRTRQQLLPDTFFLLHLSSFLIARSRRV